MAGSGSRRSKLFIILLGVGALMAALSCLLPTALFSGPAGKYRVAMAGRSVMDQWFKYWNWPSFLHDHAIYWQWPIPYRRYAKDGIFLEYVPVAAPHVGSNGEEYGDRMFETIRAQVRGGKKYDALFFKFCYVDFSDKRLSDEGTAAIRFEKMTSLVEKVHAYSKEQHLKLILGNALPNQTPTRYAQQLRLDLNRWLRQYVAIHPDIVLVDLFGPLTDEAGVMVSALARSKDDSHLNRKGYRVLDQELFSNLRRIQDHP